MTPMTADGGTGKDFGSEHLRNLVKSVDAFFCGFLPSADGPIQAGGRAMVGWAPLSVLGMGRNTVNSDPWPTSLRTVIRPP